ncbi:hypothetical protein AKJ41_01705 [candidate division MSBL1 archaeon SCGC-AAA259O05]|uniref:Uncharacterized protein n=1 Tax=candidate division MSBL1 archaeon SCGC-AAA259O05 TaxID=1698271 RepID=A0A133V4L4_9EURY|nr:hypothetical protein AKJ41_01705 [candidate division MSBL1 archaeon SCGC-AAA259O05]
MFSEEDEKNNTESTMNYWYLHEETLWRYGLENDIIEEKTKIAGITLGDIFSGEIKFEDLPEVTRQQILNSILENLEEEELITSFWKKFKDVKSDFENYPSFELEDLSHEQTGRLVKFIGNIRFPGRFTDDRGYLLGYLNPLTIEAGPSSSLDIGPEEYYSLSGLPLILDEKFLIDDVRIPQMEEWNNYIFSVIGSVVQNPNPFFQCIAIYRNASEFENLIEEFIQKDLSLPETFRKNFPKDQWIPSDKANPPTTGGATDPGRLEKTS